MLIRRALIIYCGNTESGPLIGPHYDNLHYLNFLKSKLGGNWLPHEIQSLTNPTPFGVSRAITNFLNNAHYTFIIFSGHGYFSIDTNRQFVELRGKSISILNLRTNAPRQTLIVDACRG